MAIVLCCLIVGRSPEHRIRGWAHARNGLNLAITAEQAEWNSASKYLERLEKVRVALADDRYEKVGGKRA